MIFILILILMMMMIICEDLYPVEERCDDDEWQLSSLWWLFWWWWMIIIIILMMMITIMNDYNCYGDDEYDASMNYYHCFLKRLTERRWLGGFGKFFTSATNSALRFFSSNFHSFFQISLEITLFIFWGEFIKPHLKYDIWNKFVLVSILIH